MAAPRIVGRFTAARRRRGHRAAQLLHRADRRIGELGGGHRGLHQGVLGELAHVLAGELSLDAQRPPPRAVDRHHLAGLGEDHARAR